MYEMNLDRVGDHLKEFPWKTVEEMVFFYGRDDVFFADDLVERFDGKHKAPGRRAVVYELEFEKRRYRCVWITCMSMFCECGRVRTRMGRGVRMHGPILTELVEIDGVEVQRYIEEIERIQVGSLVFRGVSFRVGRVQLRASRIL